MTDNCIDDQETSAKVRDLNDRFRRSLTGGTLMLTQGIVACGVSKQATIFAAIKGFDGFDSGNDPWNEHDFGEVVVEGEQIFFKIDYFDRGREWLSPDPSDPAVTERVMTVMLAAEY